MKKYKRIHYAIIASLVLCSGWSMPSLWRKNKADNLYKKEEYTGASDIYQDLQIDYPFNADINYNKGNVLYRLEKYEEAESAFKKVLQSKDKDIIKKAYYNIGNTLYRQGMLEEAIKSYEETLKIDSTDQDAEYNIALIKKKLQKKQQQQEQEEQKQQKPDKDKNKNQDDKKENKQGKQQTSGEEKQENKENKSDKKAEDKQDRKNKDEKKPESGNDDKNDRSDKNKKNSPEEKAKREQARQILDAIKQDEKKLKQNMNEKEIFKDNDGKDSYDW